MGVVDRIMEHADRLTTTERRIAEVLAAEPQAIAFGTVAQVAEKASTSGPSVVRLAVKLGYAGFVGLQAAVQSELSSQLGPAHARIREQPPTDLSGRVREAELDNVSATLAGVSEETLEAAVGYLGDPARRVWVIAGEVTGPVGSSVAAQLAGLREGVTLLNGPPTGIGRALAGAQAGDLLVAIDIRRYERLLVSVVRVARQRGLVVLALTDGPLSPLAGQGITMFIAASAVGPYDSMTGALALTNLLVTATAARLRPAATGRLDAVEELWSGLDAVVLGPGTSSAPVAGQSASAVALVASLDGDPLGGDPHGSNPDGDTLGGSALDGGALDGGALDGGALDGGALDGGALDGGALVSGALVSASLDAGPPPAATPPLDGGALDGASLDGTGLDGAAST